MVDVLDKLGELARSANQGDVSAELHEDGRKNLVAMATALRNGIARSRSRFGTRSAAFAAAAALFLAVGTYTYFRPLAYEVEGARSLGSDYLSAPADHAAKVRFEDGTVVNAEPGTRLRIDGSTRSSARVLVERGTASAHVKHGLESSWQFVAGPFIVHVTGTKFTLSWEPAIEEIELTLHEGSVEIESPLGRGRFAVRAGQRFHASLPKGSMGVDAIATADAAAPAAAVPPVSEAPVSENTAADQARPAQPPEPAPGADQKQARQLSWSELVRRGEFTAVVEAARDRGIESCLAGCTAADLRALADAARYRGEAGLAEKSLVAMRNRFAGSSAAAFLLGRVKELGGDLGAAERWYGTYLGEAPRGEYAADALAGRMRIALGQRGKAAAKPLALEYMNRYPDGVHAARAKQIANEE
jgi:hypothetical protein